MLLVSTQRGKMTSVKTRIALYQRWLKNHQWLHEAYKAKRPHQLLVCADAQDLAMGGFFLAERTVSFHRAFAHTVCPLPVMASLATL